MLLDLSKTSHKTSVSLYLESDSLGNHAWTPLLGTLVDKAFNEAAKMLLRASFGFLYHLQTSGENIPIQTSLQVASFVFFGDDFYHLLFKLKYETCCQNNSLTDLVGGETTHFEGGKQKTNVKKQMGSWLIFSDFWEQNAKNCQPKNGSSKSSSTSTCAAWSCGNGGGGGIKPWPTVETVEKKTLAVTRVIYSLH